MTALAAYKHMIEEVLAVIGYGLLLMAAVESALQLRLRQAAGWVLQAVPERAPARPPVVTAPLPGARDFPAPLRAGDIVGARRLPDSPPSARPSDRGAPPP